MLRKILLGSALLAAGFAACTSSNQSSDEDTLAAAQTTELSCATDGGPLIALDAGEFLPQDGGTSIVITDSQILTLVQIANDGEIAAGQLALAQAANPDVKAFAQQMVDEHTAANQRLQALAAQLGLSCALSPLSTHLLQDVSVSTAALAPLSGNEFDKAYTDLMVAQHAKLQFLQDSLLIRNATRPELQAELQNLRVTVQGHLVQAEQLQQTTYATP